jgi:uncharacterized protein (DUF1778 family)
MTNSVVFARMSMEEVKLVKQVAKARGEDLSDFVRRAVYKELASLSFLSAEQQKALGIKTEVS